MRKFLVIIVAILLAFAVVIGYGAKRQGVHWRDFNLSKAREILLSFKDRTSRTSTSDEPSIEVIPEEETLSYSEHIGKGDYYTERGFLTLAVNEYVKASNLEPRQSEPYLKLLQTHFSLGEYEKARRNADTLLLLDPMDMEARFRLAQIDLKQGATEAARQSLEELAKNFDDPRIDYELALSFIVLKQYPEAKRLLTAAIGRNPSDELRAKIDGLLGAFQEFEFAKAAETLYLDELLARTLNQNKDYELAVAITKTVLKVRPDLRDAWILLGFSYLNLGEHYFALTSFERAYTLDSSWAPTQYFLGLTYRELGDLPQAITYLSYALQNQFEPELVLKQKLAELYLETKDYPMAAKLYGEMLQNNKNDVQAFVRPIWLQLDLLKKPEEALKLAELAMTTFPENPMAYNLLGWAQIGTEDFASAEKNLKKALELDPDLAAAHFNLGKLYESKGLTREALKAYEQAYKLDPNGTIGRNAAQKYNELLTP